MDGLYPENDPPVQLCSDGNEQRDVTESNSLFSGLGCDPAADLGLFLDGEIFAGQSDEQDSLFGGDAEMQNLLARLEGEEPRQEHPGQLQEPASPLSLPSALASSSLPLSSSALQQSDSVEPLSAVSTLHHDETQNQQQFDDNVPSQEEDALLLLQDFGLDGNSSVNFDFDVDFDFGLAVEQEVTRQAQNELEPGTEKDEVTPVSPKYLVTTATITSNSLTSLTPVPEAAADSGLVPLNHAQPSIDKPSPTTDLGTRGDQECPGPSIINIDDNDSDGDVVLLSSRQVECQVQGLVSTPPPPPPPFTVPVPIPHYLELRPRCPQGPPPPRIDLGSYNVEELLPFVQLYSKLSLRGIQERMGLDVDAGKLIVMRCQDHLADPAHAVTFSGSNPAALRALKVTLIYSALALLKDSDGRAGVGSSWFGRESTLEPTSEHMWPEDSTTLTLLFIQLLYRLTRNANSRERYRKAREARAASPVPTFGELNPPQAPEASTSPEEPQLQASNEAPKEPTPPKEPKPRKRKRETPQPKAAAKPVELPVPVPVHPNAGLRYSSPSVLREALLATNASNSTTPASESDKAPSPTLTAPSPATAFAEPGFYYVSKRAPMNASIRYRVNVIDGHAQRRAIPQINLCHDGDIRAAGYSHLTDMCHRLCREVDSVSIMTILGLERVCSDSDWDRVINRVNDDELLMDGEVKILVRLLD
ncbi:hypothetical protein Sste5346_004005 [Sporothrix stenoceras]|uniref:Uncharacterized protein n=1 Tax=Sporothrix stenoceras TaxID=5173 RepID=A0ABR3ZBN3_9PEZI